MASDRVTVFGGSGFLGCQIVKCLAAEGASVRVAVRHPQRASFLERLGRDDQIELVQADVRDETTVARAMKQSEQDQTLAPAAHIGAGVSGVDRRKFSRGMRFAMRFFTRTFTSATVLVVLASVAFAEDGRAAGPLEGSTGTAPMMSDAMPGHSQIPDMMQNPGHAMGGKEGQQDGGSIPTLPGQDAFGAIQEIVRILEADPNTDWSKVNLEALRQHLIDMNEVTLRADVSPKQIDGGLEIAITGTGRTLVAIRRIIPEWAKMANGLNGWTAKVTPLPNGELLTVAATAPKEVQHIRGLGFIGLLASGSWHQSHHLAMARGEFPYLHGTH